MRLYKINNSVTDTLSYGSVSEHPPHPTPPHSTHLSPHICLLKETSLSLHPHPRNAVALKQIRKALLFRESTFPSRGTQLCLRVLLLQENEPLGRHYPLAPTGDFKISQESSKITRHVKNSIRSELPCFLTGFGNLIGRPFPSVWPASVVSATADRGRCDRARP